MRRMCSQAPLHVLWKLSEDIEPREIAMEAFSAHLRANAFGPSCGRLILSVTDVINDMDNPRYKMHADRIRKADLDFPILVVRRSGILCVLDGMHRLGKSVLRGKETICVREVTEEMVDKAWTSRGGRRFE